MAAEPKNAADFEKAVVDEWNTYVATQPIDVNGVRAFNEGDRVPASHVTRGVVSADSVTAANKKG